MGATDITAEGTPGPRTQGFYELRAKGGAAVVTVSELVVHPETDGSQMLRLSLKTPGQLGAFTYLADAIKRHGAVASIELSHSGQYAGTYMVDKEKKGDLCQWGPSDGVRPDGMPVRALSHEQIASIVAAYGEAAALAKRAGFQMVMVHAGHGWLINQFLSPYFNKREDEYGGPLENRIRFAREVLASVRSAVGPGFPIELRISGAELFEGGYDVAEGARIAHALEDLQECRPVDRPRTYDRVDRLSGQDRDVERQHHGHRREQDAEDHVTAIVLDIMQDTPDGLRVIRGHLSRFSLRHHCTSFPSFCASANAVFSTSSLRSASA